MSRLGLEAVGTRRDLQGLRALYSADATIG
jgi:hypothetical protein